MRVDEQTLTDLDVLPLVGGTSSLFALMNSTASTKGRARLLELIRTPLADVESILARQAAIRHLGRIHERVRHELSGIPFVAIERYLGTRWDISRARNFLTRSVDGLIVQFRHRDMVAELRAGVLGVVSLVRHLHALDSLLRDQAPREVELLLDEVRRMTDSEAIRSLASRIVGEASAKVVIECDAMIRGAETKPVERLLRSVAEVDALASLATATERLGWTIPEIRQDQDPTIELEGLVHPLVRDAVPNDCRMTATAVLVITGPNMAGKTTFAKAVGIAVLLAHIGAGVPSKRARISRFDFLFSSMKTVDNVAQGVSFYLSEVRRVKKLAMALQEVSSAFALLDEPFKGTNVKDASDATRFLVECASRCPRLRLILTTHLTEVAAEARSIARVHGSYFEANVIGDEITFGYQLRDGVSAQRLGMLLLQQAGVDRLFASAATRRQELRTIC